MTRRQRCHGRTRVNESLTICRDIGLVSDSLLEVEDSLVGGYGYLELQLAGPYQIRSVCFFLRSTYTKHNIPFTLIWISESVLMAERRIQAMITPWLGGTAGILPGALGVFGSIWPQISHWGGSLILAPSFNSPASFAKYTTFRAQDLLRRRVFVGILVRGACRAIVTSNAANYVAKGTVQS